MIEFKSVGKWFKGEEGPLFSSFSERIEKGEFILLTGRSGSGKTTLLRFLLKEDEPDSGEIYVNGQLLSDIKRSDIPSYRRQIGVVFQDFRLFEEYTVYGNLEMTLLLTGGRRREAEQRVTAVLRMLGIDRLYKRYPKELSGGEKQKVCLARALINNPSIVLADEPTGNLDPEASVEIMRLMELIHRKGVTVLMATHDLAAIEELAHTGRRISLDDNIGECKED
ncbi:MAG: ATP-binding cassette domain-containing protein [Lachnospiraceae bacterium]|nr:ATP-binding cassette domain-containing protein [Lachnospiraceae bacterium]